jgi:predicted  nucleic acid-binding Zn-ribbon protein
MPEQREKTIDVLRRLKAQEEKPKPKLESYSTIKPKPALKEEPVQIINIPQRNIENLMHKLDEIDRRMKTGSNSYFNLYYDLKNAEQNFMREVERIKKQNFQIPETTMKRINERVNIIEKKSLMGVK